MGSVGEFERVWRAIEYGSEEANEYLKDEKLVQCLVDGFKTYRGPGGSPEADKIKNNAKLTSVEKSTALRFSALSGLSEEQSLKIYQLNQDKIGETLKQQFLDIDMESDGENLLKVILAQMLKIYHKDRIYIIKSVNDLLESPNQGKLDSKKLVGSLVSQLETLLKASPVPPRSRDLNSEIISAMHLQNLREKCFLVETLLLSISHFPSQLNDETIKKIFKISKKYFFLLNPSSSYLVDLAVADKLKEFSIVLLQLVLIKITCHCVTKRKVDLLKTLDKDVLDLLLQSEARILAPFQLAWSMVRFLHSVELEDEGHSEKLTSLAFQSGVWRISRMILEMPQLKQSCAKVHIGQTILDLVDLVLSHVEPESGGGTIELTDTISACLNAESAIAEKFWEKFEFGHFEEDQSGLVTFINQQIRFIPLDLEVTFKLLSALSNGSGGKEKILNFLNEMKYLSEPITGEETDDDILTDETGSEWTLRRDKAIAGYTIEAGTKGELFQSSIGPIVQWNLKESVEGWNLMELIMSGENDNDLTISVLRLYANLEEVNAPIYKDGFETLFKRIVNNYSNEDYGEILTHFLDTIDHLDIYLTKKILPGSNLFAEILAQEKEISTYTNIIKIINILTNCCKKYHSVLMPSLEFVFSDIFGPHLSWKYSCIFQKIELSISLLKLVRSLSAVESKIRHMMIEMFRNSESICRIILTLSCLNSDEIDDTASTSEEFTSLLIGMVQTICL